MAADVGSGRFVGCLFTMGLVDVNLLTAWLTIRNFGLPEAALLLVCPAGEPAGAEAEPGFHTLPGPLGPPATAPLPPTPPAAAAVEPNGADGSPADDNFFGAPKVGKSKSKGFMTGSGGGAGASVGCVARTPAPPPTPALPTPRPNLGPPREGTGAPLLLPSPLLPIRADAPKPPLIPLDPDTADLDPAAPPTLLPPKPPPLPLLLPLKVLRPLLLAPLR